MTRAQKKIIVAWCIAAIALVAFPSYESLISAHWHVLKWVVFAALLLVTAVKKDIPTRAERHAAFAQLIDEHPWVKLYMVAYSVIVLLGVSYVVSEHIYITDHIGFMLSAIGGLFLPVFIIKQREAWHDAEH